MDLIPWGSRSSDAFWLMLSAATAGIALVFFVAAPFGLAIRWLITRNRGLPSTVSSRLTAVSILCGTAMSASVIVMLASMLLNPYAKVGLFNGCILVIWIFGLAGASCAIGAALTGRNPDLIRKQRWFRAIAALIGIMLYINLAVWKFFYFIA